MFLHPQSQGVSIRESTTHISSSVDNTVPVYETVKNIIHGHQEIYSCRTQKQDSGCGAEYTVPKDRR